MAGTFEQPQVVIDVDALRAQASLEKLPWPLTVTGVKARFDGNQLDVQGLAGSMGESRFSQCSGQITFAAASQLHVSGCDADLALAELFDWGSKQVELPEGARSLRLLAGRGLVQVRRISGALAQPAKWSADISVKPQGRAPDAPAGAR